jgi:hypothetical protein
MNAAVKNFLPVVQRWWELFPLLPDIVAGNAEPTTPAEGGVFARLCAQPFQMRFAMAVRLFTSAFSADPQLANDLTAGNRYSAVCYAARAARGDGVDAPSDADERTALRAKALAWLRADLDLREQQAASSNAVERKTAADMMTLWLRDTDLVGIRDEAALAKLPPAERETFTQLWADVAAILKKAEEKAK